MKKCRKVLAMTSNLVFFFLVLLFPIACSKNELKGENDYPVTGIWHATTSWHVDNPYNYGGDTYQLDVWFDFRTDATMRLKQTMTLNGYIINENKDWIICKSTWTVKGNIITLSTGEEYVIVDNMFNDIYPNPKKVLYFKKLSNDMD